MADSSYLKSLVGSLPPDVKAALGRCWDYLCDGNLRFGPVNSQRPRTENFAGRYVTATTPATANAEFTIAHGLGANPGVLIPMLNLTSVGSSLPTLTVTKAPDAARIYLSSPSTNVTFCGILE